MAFGINSKLPGVARGALSERPLPPAPSPDAAPSTAQQAPWNLHLIHVSSRMLLFLPVMLPWSLSKQLLLFLQNACQTSPSPASLA